MNPMPGTSSSLDPARAGASGRTHPLVPWAIAALGGALLAAAVLLWVRHGTAVFFDIMTAGIAACL